MTNWFKTWQSGKNWLFNGREAMLKRTADWLEKMSVAAMAVGIFQSKYIGIFLGVACYLASLYLTRLGGK